MTAHSRRISYLYYFLLLPVMFYSQEHPSIHEEELEECKSENTIVEPVNVISGLENLISNLQEKVADQKIGIVTNHTGLDSRGWPNWIAIEEGTSAEVVAIFTPEHGLSGKFLAGERVAHDSEMASHLPEIFSLYGSSRKPTAEMLNGIDLLIYDIQDIGARFYTYITTLGLVMEAAAENNVPVLVLDRPNPITGTNVSGSILDLTYQSFVGYYPIPVQYGLTPGELAQMIAGEEWIDSIPELDVIPMINWSRELWYDETTLKWVPTSPNIPDVATATVYPGICFLEATNISEGRGTPLPFLQVGAPWIDGKLISQKLNQLNLKGVVFRPVSFMPHHPEKSGHKKYHEETCYGVRIVVTDRRKYDPVLTGVHLMNLIHEMYPNELEIREDSLNRLFGTDDLSRIFRGELILQDILDVMATNASIFLELRIPYLLY